MFTGMHVDMFTDMHIDMLTDMHIDMLYGTWYVDMCIAYQHEAECLSHTT